LKLTGSTGYNKTLQISKCFQANLDDNTIDVHFDNVPTTASYTLSYITADGTESPIISNVPYHTLQDDS